MKVIFGVENFGKIKHAEIVLGNLVLFVGENNSGKTFMMQLLYGTMSAVVQVPGLRLHLDSETKYVVNQEILQAWEKTINQYLGTEKERIVKEIFHQEIPIARLYIRVSEIDMRYIVKLQKKEEVYDEIESIGGKVKNSHAFQAEIYKVDEKGKEEFCKGIQFFGRTRENLVEEVVAGIIMSDLLGLSEENSKLFLPASRTGMLLLYRYFFAEKDHAVYEQVHSEGEKRNLSNRYGLSAPVYDFLKFLLRFTPENLINERNQNLLDFIEENIIDGSLSPVNDELYYTPKHSAQRIPLYLSSSLINELAPVVRMLSSVDKYDNIFYDEIETCLHPLKQKAMARLIIRLVNSGKRMIISTHSDTMAANLNNLLTLVLGEMDKDEVEQKMQELGLEKEDVLQNKEVHVYQFVNEEDGLSFVHEVEFRTVENLGYNFQLFENNLQILSEDTMKIME